MNKLRHDIADLARSFSESELMALANRNRIYRLPIPIQCGHYHSRGNRCQDKASRWITHPDGTLNPGGFVCQAHADAPIAEYAEKLKEQWGSIPIVYGEGGLDSGNMGRRWSTTVSP